MQHNRSLHISFQTTYTVYGMREVILNWQSSYLDRQTALYVKTTFTWNASASDLELFVCWSAWFKCGTGKKKKNQVGFAVIIAHHTYIAQPLPANYFSQAAEPTAPVKACRLAKDKTVNIHTDNLCAFGIVYDFGPLWKNIVCLTSSDKPIAHHKTDCCV